MAEKLYSQEDAFGLYMKAFRKYFTTVRVREYESGTTEMLSFDDWGERLDDYIAVHREELGIE